MCKQYIALQCSNTTNTFCVRAHKTFWTQWIYIPKSRFNYYSHKTVILIHCVRSILYGKHVSLALFFRFFFFPYFFSLFACCVNCVQKPILNGIYCLIVRVFVCSLCKHRDKKIIISTGKRHMNHLDCVGLCIKAWAKANIDRHTHKHILSSGQPAPKWKLKLQYKKRKTTPEKRKQTDYIVIA